MCNEHIDFFLYRLWLNITISRVFSYASGLLCLFLSPIFFFFFLNRIHIQYKQRKVTDICFHSPPPRLPLLHRWVSRCSDCAERNDTGLFLVLQFPLRYHSNGEAGRPEARVYAVRGPQDVETGPSRMRPGFDQTVDSWVVLLCSLIFSKCWYWSIWVCAWMRDTTLPHDSNECERVQNFKIMSCLCL